MGFRLVTRVSPRIKDPRVIAELARGFLRGVVACNRVEMRLAKARGRPIPPLYRSGVVYRREPRRSRFDRFDDVEIVLQRGHGDCEDLAAWRIAELQEAGEEDADFRIYWRRPRADGRMTMHVEVRRGQRGNYEIEDPSRFLGL